MEPSDAEMMARLASGEALSLNGLMSRCWEKVTAFLFRMTRHFDGRSPPDRATRRVCLGDSLAF